VGVGIFSKSLGRTNFLSDNDNEQLNTALQTKTFPHRSLSAIELNLPKHKLSVEAFRTFQHWRQLQPSQFSKSSLFTFCYFTFVISLFNVSPDFF
jgi:hypothetical protein